MTPLLYAQPIYGDIQMMQKLYLLGVQWFANKIDVEDIEDVEDVPHLRFCTTPIPPYWRGSLATEQMQHSIFSIGELQNQSIESRLHSDTQSTDSTGHVPRPYLRGLHHGLLFFSKCHHWQIFPRVVRLRTGTVREHARSESTQMDPRHLPTLSKHVAGSTCVSFIKKGSRISPGWYTWRILVRWARTSPLRSSGLIPRWVD